MDEEVPQKEQRPEEPKPHGEPGGTTCHQVLSSGSDGNDSSENKTKADNSSDSDESKARTSLSDSDIDNVNQSTDHKAIGETALVSYNTNSVFDSVDTLSSQTKVGRNEVPNMTQEQRHDNRLKHMLPHYVEYDAPFRNVENINFELDDLVGYSDETSRPDIRSVLTLFELCIRSVSAKHFRQKQQLISSTPRPIKHVLHERRRDQTFTRIQLSSLHDLLAFMERDSIMLTTLKNYGVNVTTITTYRDLIVRTRNIWNDDAFESIYRDYMDGECTSILPFSYVNQVKCPAGDWGEVVKCFPICQLSVVASVIEMMLPQHISLGLLSNAYRNCSSESELIRKATDTMVYSVRKKLQKRFHLHTSGLTTKWHSFNNNSPLPHAPVHRHGLHIVPTLTEVYRDADIAVHLSCSDYSLLDIKSTAYAQQLTLFWTGPGDQGVKLDLIPFLKVVFKKRALEAIEATKTSNRFRNPSPSEKGGAIWEEKMKMSLEYCFAEGYKMSQHTVEEVKNRLWEKILKFTHQSDKRRKLSKKEIQEDNPSEKPTSKYKPDSFSIVVEECFAYKDTVYLAVYDTYTPKRIQVQSMDEEVPQKEQRPEEPKPHGEPGGTTCHQVLSSGSDGNDSSENKTKADNSSDSDESKARTSLSDSDIDNVNQSTDHKAIGETALVSYNTNSVFDSVDTLSSQTKVGRNEVPNMTQEQRHDNRLKHMLPHYVEYDAPFRNVENINFELDDLVGYSDETSRPDIRSVLTLFELCIRSVSAKHFRQKQQLISSTPRPIKHVLHERRRDQTFTRIQLSSLHDLLAFMERDSIMLTTLKNYGVNVTTITTYRDLIVRTRNIWNDDAFESIYRDYMDGECTSILPFSYVNQVKCPAGDWGEVVKCFPICQLSVVASVIEMMLPQHISLGLLSNAYRNCSSESELIRKATDTMVYSVRKKLQKRYPAIVEVFFKCALPYVFWARGNIKLAAECFLRIAQTEDENSRAVFLCEAARLYAQNEEPMKAKQLYMEASDSIMWRSRLQWEEKAVGLQKFMLMASVYDQGVMTAEKATQAAGAWEGAMNFLYPSCPQRSSLQPVESFLCFHSGTAQGSVQDRLEYCVKLIERLVDSFEFLLLHLSLVMALLGDEKKSLRAFSTLILREKLEMPLPWQDNQHNPWQPVLDHVAEHGTPKFLKVIWRTQLGHLRIVNSMNSFEGDYQSMADLNLRLTDAGFITADLQMMLPPIRALNLDPYTGFHLHTSGLTTKWHSFNNNSPLPHAPVHRHGLHIVPTLTEVYRDADIAVHLSCSDYSLLDIKSTAYAQQLTLFWTGPGDQGVKLDLIPFLKVVFKKRALEAIEATKTSNRFRNPSPSEKGGAIWEEKMKMSLEYCFAEGYKMSQHTVEEVKNRLWEKILKFTHQSDKRRKLSKKEIQEDNPSEKPTSKYKPDSFSIVVEECFAYKDTVYLAVYDTYTPKRIQVFVGCSSKESFMQPFLTTEHSHDFCDRIDDPQASSIHSLKMTSKHRSLPPDDIMWHMDILKEYRNHRKQYVYGKKGKLLKTISDNQMVAPHVLGSKLYGLTADKLRIRCDPITEDEILSEEFTEIGSLLFGGQKVMAVTESAIYFLHRDTLQTLSVTQQHDISNVKVSEDGRYISFLPGSPVKILEQKKLEEKTRLAFGIGSMLMFVDVTDDVVEVVIDLLVPGVATEVYSIREDVDFLVSVTVQKGGEGNFYREHVFQYNHHGKILGVLPFLGPGPRCFCVEYLKELDGVTDTNCGRRGWHVFMRDGHEGIIGVRL